MSLLHRITRLFKADLHGLLDALEEPQAMLKQSLREMHEEIELSETRLKSLDKQLERLQQQQRELQTAQAEFAGQIDFCFSEADDAMVKTLLRKKLQTGNRLKAGEQHRKALQEERALLAAELTDRQDKLKSILDKLALFADYRAEAAVEAAADGTDAALLRSVTEEDVEIAFLQEKRLRMQQQTQREEPV